MTPAPREQLPLDLDDLLRPLAGGATSSASSAVPTVVDALVRAGWVTPPEQLREWAEQLGGSGEDLIASLVDEPAVRSISEDLAVERARQQRLLAAVAATRARAAAALERSAALSAKLAAEQRAWAAAAAQLEQPSPAAAPLDPAAPEDPAGDGPTGDTLPEDDPTRDHRRVPGGGSGPAAASPTRAELLAEVEQLRYALRNRPPVEQAVGMVMLALSCDAGTAWEALATLSQQTNRRVRHVAEAMNDQAERGELRPEHLAAVFAGLTPPFPGAAELDRPESRLAAAQQHWRSNASRTARAAGPSSATG